ncbi:MAG: SAM-dependent methyltransferase [Chloroflexi bacterium]|nr:MAG: SAM-dependent methyltransferase [Chloroflexota bacterium]
MKPFVRYGEYYDLLYQDKDYERECDFIEEVFRSYSRKPVRSVLDIGCGTGGHAIPLAMRGYEVMGIDASEVVIEAAKQKVQLTQADLCLHVMDMRSLRLDRKFDACICMFAVMDYLITNDDIRLALANIKNHLEKGSVFTFDCWNGLAVLRMLPSVTVKTMVRDDRKVTRIAQPELDALHHLCHVKYHLIITNAEAVIDEVDEQHTVRYLFPQEIAHYLEDADFELLKMCPFGDLHGTVDEHVWNISIVARRKG